MSRRKTALANVCSLLALSAGASLATGVALAQTAPDPQSTDVVVIEGRRLSQADEAIGVDEASNTVAVTREALLSAPAGVSGLKMLEGLPGFNVQTEGALGLYEFGNAVTVRAFNLQQVGFVLDGIPMGRSDIFGGSPIFRYVDNENLQAVVASPGAGDVSQPSYASLGPIVEYKSIDPSSELGGTISQAWGDDNLSRTFMKFQSGDLGPLSFYVSRSTIDSDLWRGGGYVDREHWEAKARIELWDDASLTFKYVGNDFFDYDTPNMSKAQYYGATCPFGVDQPAGRYCGYGAVQPPGTLGTILVYNTPGYTYDTTNWYLDRINVRDDALYGAQFHTGLGDNASLTVTAYYEDKDGWGSSPETYGSTTSATSLYGRFVRQQQAGLPVTAPRGTAFGVSFVGGIRQGIVVKGEYEIAGHTLEAGVWLEDDDYVRRQLRLNHEGGIQTGRVLFNETPYFRRAYESTRETTQLFVKDTMSLLDDRLNVEVGVKALSIDYSLVGYRDFNDYYRVINNVGVPGWGPQSVGETYEDTFLPMVGAVYKLTQREQLFASYAENYALPRGTDDIFSISPNTQAATPAPEAETSQNFEIGARTIHSSFSGAVAVYYTTFENRIESYSNVIPGQVGAVETFYQAVGGVKSYGVELTGAWKPDFLDEKIYFNGNLTWNNSTFEDDITGFPVASVTGQAPGRTAASYFCGTALCISGNTLPDSPEWVISAGVTWEPTDWIVANISAKYQSDRYSNFINSEEVSDYTVTSAYIDFGTGDGTGPLGHLKARINVDNLFDVDELAYLDRSIGGLSTFRPLNPRTVSFTLTADF
jgi:iron complex outermembrane receptor protein